MDCNFRQFLTTVLLEDFKFLKQHTVYVKYKN